MNTIQSRLSEVMAHFLPIALSGDGAADERDLRDKLTRANIIVLPTCEHFSFTSVPGLNAKSDGHVTVEMLFTFMDNTTADNVTMRAVGVAEGSAVRLNMDLLGSARRNALLSLFYHGLPDMVLVEQAEPVETVAGTVGVMLASGVPPVEAVKETVNATLRPDTSNLTTADQAPAPKQTKKGLADNSNALLEWQNGIDKLSIEQPDEWDIHVQRLKELDFLNEDDMKAQFGGMKRIAASYGVGYDKATMRFFLNHVPELT